MVPLVLQGSECLLFWHPVAPVLDLTETSQAIQFNKSIVQKANLPTLSAKKGVGEVSS